MVQNDLAVFSLMDFNQDEGNNILFRQFKIKMRNSEQHKRIPFSMKFEEIGIIKPEEHSFYYPSDVKISHSHHCVCVADEYNKEIKLFDLTSFKLLACFAFDSLSGLFIEENYDDQQNDAIYFGEYSNTFKYRVKDLLNLENNSECLWDISRDHIFGMAMRKVGINKKELFRFNCHHVMDVIDPENGNIIRQLEFKELSSVIALVFITSTRMIVTDINNNKCLIFDEMNEIEWKLVKTIEQADGVYFSQPLGLAIDRKGEKIFLSDFDRKRIVVLNLEGDVLFSYSCNLKKLNPFGLDFDERTGLLYVADQQDHSIRIFK